MTGFFWQVIKGKVKLWDVVGIDMACFLNAALFFRFPQVKSTGGVQVDEGQNLEAFCICSCVQLVKDLRARFESRFATMGRRLSQWWWSGEQCWMRFHLTDIELIRIGSESLERLWLFMDFTCYNWPRRWFKTEIPVLHQVKYYVTMLHSGAGASVDKHLEVTYLHFLQKCEVLGFVCRLAVGCVCVCVCVCGCQTLVPQVMSWQQKDSTILIISYNRFFYAHDSTSKIREDQSSKQGLKIVPVIGPQWEAITFKCITSCDWAWVQLSFCMSSLGKLQKHFFSRFLAILAQRNNTVAVTIS